MMMWDDVGSLKALNLWKRKLDELVPSQVRLNGDFVISAQKSFDDPCIHVLGSLEVRGTSSIQG